MTFKFLLVTTLCLPISLFARDCATEASNFALGFQLHSLLIHQMEQNNPNPCSVAQPEYEDSRESKVKMTRIIRDQLKNKKKTSSIFFLDMGGETDKEEVTETELCALVDKNINKETSSSCTLNRMKQNILSTSLMDMNYADGCRALLDDVKSSRQKCLEDAEKVSRRDPPGEEIAPAEETPSTKTNPTFTTPAGFVGRRVIIPSMKPSSRRTSSGATSQ